MFEDSGLLDVTLCSG